MKPETLSRVEESLSRCNESEGFLGSFYENLLASSPVIPPMFENTDFERQHKLLQHGLGVLLIYAKRRNPALLERIADRHSRNEIDVEPSLYPFFVESLLKAVERHDPEYGLEIADAWREVVAPGIEFLKSRY